MHAHLVDNLNQLLRTAISSQR